MRAVELVHELPNIRRAWPGKDGLIIVEGWDDQNRLRAGNIDTRQQLTWFDYAADPALPGLDASNGTELVVHRLGRRAVERKDDRYTKQLRAGRAGGQAQSVKQVSQLISRVGLTSPEVLRHDDHSIDFAILPGRSLHDLGGESRTDPESPDLLASWREFVRLWPLVSGLESEHPIHQGSNEAANLLRWYLLAAEFSALPYSVEIEAQIVLLCTRLAEGTHTLGLAHRDLHDKQIFWDGAQIGVLDWDTAARAEPSLDWANLWAHIDLRECQGHYQPAFAEAVRGLLTEAFEQMGLPGERLWVYYQAARWRLACVYAFRPGSRSWLGHWLDESLAISKSEESGIGR